MTKFSLATTVNFDQAVYSIDEDAESVQPILVLSNPSSFAIIIHVFTGEYQLATVVYGYCRFLYVLHLIKNHRDRRKLYFYSIQYHITSWND